MGFDLDNTRTLLGVMSKTNIPSTLLVDTFFPQVITFPTTDVDVDYEKGGRKMAPFIVSGAGGVNIGREGFKTIRYTPPTMAPITMRI